MQNTKQKWDITELSIILEIKKMWITVLTPIWDNDRYDIVIEKDWKFLRIQCKTAYLKHDNTIHIQNYSINRNNKKHIKKKYTKEEIDFLWTFYNWNAYLISIDEVWNKNGILLRFKPTLNKQRKCINHLDDYKIDKQLKKIWWLIED